MTEHNALRQAQSEVVRMSQRMAMGEMAASIVHEINQPLAAIAANADAGQRWLSRERPDIEEARAAFKRIVGDSRRASAIIDEIRLMFRHDGMTTAALDVNELIREVLSLLRGDLENHRIGVDAALPDGLPRQLGDIVVCPERAEADGTPIALLLVHGALHLVGYDHEADNGDMLRRQQAIFEGVEPVAVRPS
jgi:C4-dicarboxylate-specific signal transduction histidine kinase